MLVWLGLVPACSRGADFNAQLEQIVRPYAFNAFRWELDALSGEAARVLTGAYRSETDAGKVLDYFAGMRKRADLEPLLAAVRNGDRAGDASDLASELTALEQGTDSSVGAVESILGKQINDTLASQGIFNPLFDYTGLKIGFPPVSMKVEKPIHLLVISRRDKIGTVTQVILIPDLSVTDMERVEDQVDSLGVSSLVVELGGTAVLYPTFVSNRGSLRYTISAAAEEWTHQYLAFKPLGFRYVLYLLGVSHDRDIPTMNETVAGIVSREISGTVYRQYYAQNDRTPPRRPQTAFNNEMRDIRRQVDTYLAAGEVDRAEQYMKDARQHLASEGFYLRKLNQAYFSFYANYATAPGSITRMGEEFDRLRARSQSLADFLDKSASLTNHRQLEELLK